MCEEKEGRLRIRYRGLIFFVFLYFEVNFKDFKNFKLEYMLGCYGNIFVKLGGEIFI